MTGAVVVDTCPDWCVKSPHRVAYPDIDNVVVHETMEMAYCPPATGARSNGQVRVNIARVDQLADDEELGAGAPFVCLWADDAQLTAEQTRRVAAQLLEQADELDQITS